MMFGRWKWEGFGKAVRTRTDNVKAARWNVGGVRWASSVGGDVR